MAPKHAVPLGVLADLLCSMSKHSALLLSMNPRHWTVRYEVFVEGDEPPRVTDAWQLVKDYHGTFTRPVANAHVKLSELVERIACLAGFDRRRLAQIGTSLLASTELPLGVPGDDTGESPDVWTQPHRDYPEYDMLRFQDALAFVACPPSRSHVDRAREYRVVSNRILLVSTYTERPGVIHPRNVASFVGEQLYFIGSSMRRPVGAAPPVASSDALTATELRRIMRSTISLVLLPLRGLGQWRACASWMGPEDISGRSPEALSSVEGLVPGCLALEEVYSGAILEQFLHAVSQLQFSPLSDSGDRLDEPWVPFADLWWSDRIVFRRGREVVAVLARNRNGDLVPFEPFRQDHMTGLHREPGRFLELHHLDGSLRLIRIDLRLLTVCSAYDENTVSLLVRLLGFDRVEYATRIVDMADDEQDRWERGLAERLGRAALALDRRRAELRRERSSESIGVLGHHLGKLMQEAGLANLEYMAEDHHLPKLSATLARLYPAWGLAEATSLFKCDGRGLPSDWLQRGAPKPCSRAEITDAVERLCAFYLVGMASMLPQEWDVVFAVDGTERRLLLERVRERKMPTLPPFDDTELRTGTTVVSLGLAELIRNIRHYLHDYRRDFRTAIRERRLDAAMLRFIIEATSSSVWVRIRYPLLDSIREPTSYSVHQIQRFERALLVADQQRIAETIQATSLGPLGDGLRQAEAQWTYHFGRVVGFDLATVA